MLMWEKKKQPAVYLNVSCDSNAAQTLSTGSLQPGEASLSWKLGAMRYKISSHAPNFLPLGMEVHQVQWITVTFKLNVTHY